jgi:SAM-dependent methyltransferase
VTPPDLYDLVFRSKDYGREAQHVQMLVAERVRNPHSLLDVACGTGRHLEHFARWYDAEGVDIDPAMLAFARARLAQTPLHVGDMRDFNLRRSFDVVTCLFSAIAAMRTFDELRQAVENMARHLRPGGVLIVEPWDPPVDPPAEAQPWVDVVEEPGRKVVVMETSTLAGRVWVEDAHYLVWTPQGIDHRSESGEAGAFTHDEHLAAFEAAGLDVEHDAVGLIGRGLYLGARRA